jgi:hypothetical protein
MKVLKQHMIGYGQDWENLRASRETSPLYA